MTLQSLKRYCCLTFIFFSVTSLYGIETLSSKLYDVPKAMVMYQISGGGVLSQDVNLSIEGKGKLRFKEWGKVEFREKQIEVRTTGALHYRKVRHFCEKRQEKQILDVDYHTKKILERPLPKGKKRRNITAGLEKSGQQMIANIVCDMWEGQGVKHCIYKGIPLYTEYYALGLLYREEATEVTFDINVTDISQCTMPAYPIEKFSLYMDSFKTMVKTESKKTQTSFKERLKETIEIFKKQGLDENKLSQVQRQKLLNILVKPIFEEQKKILPNLLNTLKETRVCLSRAKNTKMANICMRDIIRLKSYFNKDRRNKIDDWDKERRAILEDIDEKIVFLQSKMRCIRSAQNFTDLATCMNH